VKIVPKPSLSSSGLGLSWSAFLIFSCIVSSWLIENIKNHLTAAPTDETMASSQELVPMKKFVNIINR
jgi:hypothetical protein